MAIEFKIKGRIELCRALQDSLLSALGADAEATECHGLDFALASPLLLVTGSSQADPASGGDALIFLRVVDKARVIEAITLALACVGAVMASTTADLSLWRDEHLLLRRRDTHVQLFGLDRSEKHPFWTAERRRLVHHPR